MVFQRVGFKGCVDFSDAAEHLVGDGFDGPATIERIIEILRILHGRAVPDIDIQFLGRGNGSDMPQMRSGVTVQLDTGAVWQPRHVHLGVCRMWRH
jgi:hypothetical protein